MKNLILFAFFYFAISSSFCQKQDDGSILITYRSKPASLLCGEITTDPNTGKLNYVGRVDIYEGTNWKNGRLLSQASYFFGKRQGKAWELDYENDLQHYLYYHDGVLSDTNKIRYLSNKNWLPIMLLMLQIPPIYSSII